MRKASSAVGLEDAVRGPLGAGEWRREGGERGDGRGAARARTSGWRSACCNSRGYYDATAISTIDQRPEDPGTSRATISAKPGPSTAWATSTGVERSHRTAGLLLRELQPQSGRSDRGRARAGRRGQCGAAAYRSRAIRSSRSASATSCSTRKPMSATIRCRSTLGPRAVFGEIRTEVGGGTPGRRRARPTRAAGGGGSGRARQRRARQLVFDADHIKVLRRYKPGDPLRRTARSTTCARR